MASSQGWTPGCLSYVDGQGKTWHKLPNSDAFVAEDNMTFTQRKAAAMLRQKQWEDEQRANESVERSWWKSHWQKPVQERTPSSSGAAWAPAAGAPAAVPTYHVDLEEDAPALCFKSRDQSCLPPMFHVSCFMFLLVSSRCLLMILLFVFVPTVFPLPGFRRGAIALEKLDSSSRRSHGGP